jgi:hypothetical protein
MNLGLIVPAILTLGIYSILYKETPVYRFFEHLFIGTTLGYSIVVNIRSLNQTAFQQLLAGNYVYLLAIILGLMMYSRYFGSDFRWLNRLPTAVVIGCTIGLALRGIPESNINRQLKATYQPLFGVGDALTTVNNIILFTAFFFSLLYFTYTLSKSAGSRSGAVDSIITFGRYFLMVYFGALFGNVIIHRASLFISRMQFYVFDFFGI